MPTPLNIAIVGASSGIGLALCTQLLEDGHHVWAFSRSTGALPTHPNLHYTAFDALGTDSLQASLPAQLHGLAYCPGTINLMPFHRIKPEQFQEEFELNVMGAIRSIQSALPALKAAGSASVVLFSTVAVQTGMPFHASIAAAKGAIEGLTRSLAAEYAAQRIRFNAIAPSLTDTPLAARLTATPEKREASDKRHPIGRMGTPEDLANLSAFLLSNKSSWITGQVLHADGGMGSLKLIG